MKRVIMLAAMMQLNGAASRYGATLLRAGQTYFQPTARQVIQPTRGLTTPARTGFMSIPSVARTSSLLRPTTSPAFLSGENRIPVSAGGPVCRSFSSSGKPESTGVNLALLGLAGLYLGLDAETLIHAGGGALAGYYLGRSTGNDYLREADEYWESKLQAGEKSMQEKQKNFDSMVKQSVDREINYELKLHSQELDDKIGMYKDQETAAKAELEKELNESTSSLYSKASQIADLAKRKEAASRVLTSALARGEKNLVEQTILSKISDELNNAQKAYEESLQAYKARTGSRVVQE